MKTNQTSKEQTDLLRNLWVVFYTEATAISQKKPKRVLKNLNTEALGPEQLVKTLLLQYRSSFCAQSGTNFYIRITNPGNKKQKHLPPCVFLGTCLPTTVLLSCQPLLGTNPYLSVEANPSLP